MPSRWELKVWMTTRCGPFVHKLHREKITYHCTTKESRDLPLVIHTHHLHSLSTPLIHCPGGTRNNFNTSLVPVQDQFWGDFFHCYCGDNISQDSRDPLFSLSKQLQHCLSGQKQLETSFFHFQIAGEKFFRAPNCCEPVFLTFNRYHNLFPCS